MRGVARTMRRRGQLPLPESPRRLLLIRAVSIAALVVTGAYLAWRALFTVNLDAWFIGVPMLALEVHAAVARPGLDLVVAP